MFLAAESYWLLWTGFWAVTDVVLATAVTVHAVLWKRESRAVIGWVGLVWLSPFLGTFIYLCFGINRISRKAAALKLKAKVPKLNLPVQDSDRFSIEQFRETHPNLVGLAMAGRQLTGWHAAPGNQVTPLINGEETYPAMLAAIDKAEKSVSLLSYIFDSDVVGDRFLDALVRAQERGVEVRVLIDGVGARYSKQNMIRRLRAAGVNTGEFLPTRIPLPRYANMRNHRKILVVDGCVGFTGGTNIRAGHCLDLPSDFPVQCLHFELCGPVVRHLQRAFVMDWGFATGEILHGELWFPEVKRCGDVWARGVEHGPDEQFEKLTDLISAAIACARRRLRIVTPYFLPNGSLIQALSVAQLRGVDVEIYLPSNNNVVLVEWASRADMWQILEHGCRVYYTPEPFDHTKLMLVDDAWALIGSTNWDPRSLRLNFEFNVECYNAELVARLHEIVDKKAVGARPYTLEDAQARTFPIRLRDGLARLLKPYL